jgi:medium-chain acyl-[acyl-carrier-protein] hydrolase
MDHVDGGAWQYGDESVPETSQTFVGGTYNGHPLALAAALAVLKRLQQAGPKLHEELNQRTTALACRLNAFFEDEDLPLHIEQFSSLFRFVASGSDTDLFYAALRQQGVYATEVRNCFLSVAHTDADVAKIETAVRNAANILYDGGFLRAPRIAPSQPEARADWLKRLGGSEDPRLRLICLPYAGGGSRIYRTWPDRLPADIEVFSVQLPGREARMGEEPIADFEALMDHLSKAIEPLLDRPWVLYGHSMGATLAYELARRSKATERLAALFVGAENSPLLPLPVDVPDTLEDAELIRWAQELGAEVNAAAAPHFLPQLRADLGVCASYRHQPGQPLDCPLHVFGGSNDPLVPAATLHEWLQLTRGPSALHQVDGGHFFLEEDPECVLAVLRHELAKLTACTPELT